MYAGGLIAKHAARPAVATAQGCSIQPLTVGSPNLAKNTATVPHATSASTVHTRDALTAGRSAHPAPNSATSDAKKRDSFALPEKMPPRSAYTTAPAVPAAARAARAIDWKMMDVTDV